MEEDISSNIGAVMTEGGSPDLTNTGSDRYSVDQIYDIGAMTSQMIGSVKVSLITSRNASESKATVQDVPQAKMFQLKGRYSNKTPEQLSERCKIGLEQSRETITKTTKRLT